MSNLPPGTFLLVGAILLTLVRGRWLQILAVAMPAVSFIHMLVWHSEGHLVASTWFGLELIPVRADKLSLIWGYVFHIAAVLAAIYGLHVRDRTHHLCSGAYIGAAIGAVFAGDLLTLFVYWEITAITSVFLVWADGTKASIAAGMRYLLFHVGSGVLVLSGAILLLVHRGSLAFGDLGEVGMFHELTHWGEIILLLGFGIKAAFPLVHAWLPDAYSKATPAGAVVLSAFTTKMAVYALVRGFAGADILLSIGAVMCVFPLIYAMLTDDLRQTLAHILNNQLGFMVVAVGVGTPLALSGVAAMAFAHVIYKGLLFMAMGAVIHQTGSARQSELGGLMKSMRWTFVCCMVGALSVLPFNCGFVTKSLVLSAVAHEHHEWIWLIMMIGAVGAFLAAGIKVPYFAFVKETRSAHSNGRQIEEAPRHMLVAMGLSSALCVAIGIFPAVLYRLLPFEVDYHPYTWPHVVQQMQMVSTAALAFVCLVAFGYYPKPSHHVIDFDWAYRKPLEWLGRVDWQQIGQTNWLEKPWKRLVDTLAQQCSETGTLGRSVSTSAMAISAIILLAAYLLVYYR